MKIKSIPVAPIMGVVAGVGPAIGLALEGRYMDAIDSASKAIVGYSIKEQKLTPQYLKNFWLPVGVGAVGHIAASKLGLNRMLAQAGVPLLRV